MPSNAHRKKYILRKTPYKIKIQCELLSSEFAVFTEFNESSGPFRNNSNGMIHVLQFDPLKLISGKDYTIAPSAV